ncbi:MAG TPA: secretin N-terminal domain-containing protein [Gammaproteobacteria bacterium]|nr:secretin N-terminal domain-containing protein [Gammaproteobacteria bacterium]
MKRFLLAVIYLWCGGLVVLVSAQEMPLEIISMQHRPVEDVVPILQPLIAPGGTVAGMNNQLIIKTTPENLEQIKQVLATLDRSPRRLKIYVSWGNREIASSRDDSLAARVRSTDVSARLPGDHAKDGASVAVGNENNAVRYSTRATESSSQDSDVHFIMGLEGQPAWISTGESVPLPDQNVYVGPDGVVVQQSTEYHDVTSGVYVIPRLNGDQVTLEISPQRNRIDPHTGTIRTQQASSIVTGRLGEWIALGGVNESTSHTDSASLSRAQTQSNPSTNIQVKVEELPD